MLGHVTKARTKAKAKPKIFGAGRGRKAATQVTQVQATTDLDTKQKIEELVETPETVLALNLAKLKQDDIPPIAELWKNEYGFYLASFNLSFVTQRGRDCKRGVKLVRIDGIFKDDKHVSVLDVLPKTEWVDADMSATVQIGIDPLGIFGNIISTPTGISTGLAFSYSWNPKRARLITGGARDGVHWYSERSKQMPYFDGNYQVSISFARPLVPQAQTLKLHLEIETLHDIKGDWDETYTVKRDIQIKIN
jgi:hypothetical protein